MHDYSDLSRGSVGRASTIYRADAFSRFVLQCRVIDNLSHKEVDRICDALIKEYGVPVHERIGPGRPTLNGWIEP